MDATNAIEQFGDYYDYYTQNAQGNFLTEEEKGMVKKSIFGAVSDQVDEFLDSPNTCFFFTTEDLKKGNWLDLKEKGVFKITRKSDNYQYNLKLENTKTAAKLLAEVAPATT